MASRKGTPPQMKAVSESNLDDVGLDSDPATKMSGLAVRLKRKHDHDNEEIMDEMRSLFREYVELQNTKFANLQTTMSDMIKSQTEALSASMQMLSDKYDDIQKELSYVKQERREQLAYIKVLENRLENVERNSCAAKLEIRNVPNAPKETKDVLAKVVKDIGTVLDLKIENSEIKDVFRGFGKKDTLKPILVEFTTVPRKEDFLKSVRKYNKDHPECKLNTSHLKLEGASKPIFIAETLTAKGNRLFFLARDFAKANKYNYCWTSYGKVYLRKIEGSPLIRINEEADLIKLRDNST